MRVLGRMTEAVSKYWGCIAPIAMVTRTGRMLAERERNNTWKTMSPWRTSECVCEEQLMRVDGAERDKRFNGKGHVSVPLCHVSDLSHHSGLAKHRSMKAQVRSMQPQNKQ